jgi:septum formation protein
MELLRQIGLAPTVLPLRTTPPRQEVDETPLTGESPEDYVCRLARLKAEAGLKAMTGRKLTPRPILAADTTVTLDGVLLGKPVDAADATMMLRAYSGRTHDVLTGVCVAFDGRMAVRVSTSQVRFRTLDAAEIQAYIATGEVWDKAGAYGIQGARGDVHRAPGGQLHRGHGTAAVRDRRIAQGIGSRVVLVVIRQRGQNAGCRMTILDWAS